MNAGTPCKKSPLQFFLLVFALSVPFWLFGERTLPVPMNLPVSALGFVCPLIAALILVYREEKPGGIRRLLRRVFDHKKIEPKFWYVSIIFLMPLIMLLSYGVMRLMGRPLPEPDITFRVIPIFFVVFFIGAVGEEAGWMGYVVDLMQDRWSALKTGIILGSVWAIWHFVPLIQAHHTPAWIAWWSVETISLRILIVWLYNNTGKSVFAAILFHDMVNVSWSLFPNYGSHYDPAVTGAISAVIAVIVTLIWGRETLARYRNT